MIGTGGHGHCYPGATVPFGMVQLSPDNGTEGWDWCSGYNYSDSTIAGFSHTHLSGTGCGDWCDISVLPITDLVPDSVKDYRVKFKHEDERAEPGFYSVILSNKVQVNLTATEHCGIHQYYFPAGCEPFVRFNLGFAINYDSTTYSGITQLDDSTIVGYRYSRGWANVQRVYFAARFSQHIKRIRLADSTVVTKESKLKGHTVVGQLVFNDLLGKPLLMAVGLSSVSTDKALLALSETKGKSFEYLKAQAAAKWDAEMNKIQVKTYDERLKRIFYTALYHTCMAPVLYSDADGYYRNAKDSVKKMKHGQRYTVFSLWDTFRGLHPLFTITQSDRLADMMNSMLAFCDENGRLPIWDLSTWETGCMTGYHAVPVLADAVLKNTPGVNAERAFKAMKKSASQGIRGSLEYRKWGFVPQDREGKSVTKTVEYAYDDWCIAQVAKKLGHTDDYKLFMKRAGSYKMLFDKKTGFLRAKNSDSSFTKPFDPLFSTTDDHAAMYEEGNAWQYTFFVPHDLRGLARQYGSKKRFIEKLDSLFMVNLPATGGYSPPDISGMIGQYAHGNEPSHHIAYIYDFVGEAWKTQRLIPYIIDSMYHDNPENGYAGNEDCGQMSAWAVWSMMGLYPANPCGGEYVFGSPMFDEVTINLPNQKTLKITAENCSKGTPYIQKVTWNGKPYSKVYITHAELMKGGELEFVMGDRPNKKFGLELKDLPSSAGN